MMISRLHMHFSFKTDICVSFLLLLKLVKRLWLFRVTDDLFKLSTNRIESTRKDYAGVLRCDLDTEKRPIHAFVLKRMVTSEGKQAAERRPGAKYDQQQLLVPNCAFTHLQP